MKNQNYIEKTVKNVDDAIKYISENIKCENIESIKLLINEIGLSILNINMAVSYIENSHVSVEDYLAMLQKNKQKLLGTAVSDNNLREELIQNVLVEITLKKLDVQSLKLLCFLSCFNSTIIPIELLDGIVIDSNDTFLSYIKSENLLIDILKKLEKYNLLKIDDKKIIIVKTVCEKLKKAAVAKGILNYAIVYACKIILSLRKESIKTQTDILPKIIPVIINIANFALLQKTQYKNALIIYIELSKFFKDIKKYDYAKKLLNKALVINKNYIKESKEKISNDLLIYDEMASSCSNNDEAIKYLLAALNYRIKLLGTDEVDKKDILINFQKVISIYINLGNYQKAYDFYKKIIYVFEQKKMYMDENYAVILHDYGLLCKQMNKTDEAVEYFIRAIQIFEKSIGEFSISCAIVYDNLGSTYLQTKNFIEAEDKLKKALEIKQKFIEAKEEIAITLSLLSRVYIEQKKYEESESLLLKSLNLRIEATGEYSPMSARTLNELALLYDYWNKIDVAESYYMRAYEIHIKCFGEENEETLTVCENIAHFYNNNGNFEKAEEYFVKLLDKSRKVLSSEKSLLADRIQTLGAFYCNIGKFIQGETLLIEASKLYEQIYGNSSLDYIITIEKLAFEYYKNGIFEKAYDYYLEVYNKYLENYGMEHDYTLNALYQLAFVLDALDNFVEAEKAFLEVLEIKRNLANTDKVSDFVNVLEDVALFYKKNLKLDLSLKYYYEILSIYMVKYGDKSENVGELYRIIGIIHNEKNNIKEAEEYFKKASEILHPY